MSLSACELISGVSRKDLRELVLRRLPEGRFRHIFVKPNWVRHQTSPHFPIEALVTSTDLIAATLEACVQRYPLAERISVGDSPVRGCDFGLLLQQSGADRLVQRYRKGCRGIEIQFLDLRYPISSAEDASRTAPAPWGKGDPLGWREVILGEDSCLDEASSQSAQFRVDDYDPVETVASHRAGYHRYLISESVLNCDLLINLPKAKTHQKAGLTGALKNLIGVVGDKSCLVHFRSGGPGQGGDEFDSNTPWLIRLQSWTRRSRAGSHWLGRALLRPCWRVLHRASGIELEATPANWHKRLYRAGGSWPGNDTIWRMIYDVNRIVLLAPCSGTGLQQTPQRTQAIFVDAMIAGEGNGPLQPLPVHCDVLVAASNPFLCDMALARLMGFDWRRIPQLTQSHRFHGADHWRSELRGGQIVLDGSPVEEFSLGPAARRFRPAPGWEEICLAHPDLPAQSASTALHRPSTAHRVESPAAAS